MIQNQNFEKLYFYEDGKVYLQLKDNPRLFYLGCKKGDEFISHKKQKDLFRKNNSLAYNFQLITKGDFNILHTIFDKKSHFYISRADVLKYGRIMHFKDKGQEKQIFVPINAFHKSIDEVNKSSCNGINFGNASMTKPVKFINRDCTQVTLFS